MVADQPLNGNYVYVGLDLDTTGRRLIDEVRTLPEFISIVQLYLLSGRL